MQRSDTRETSILAKVADRRVVFPATIMALQAIAAVFFVVDSIEDQNAGTKPGFNFDAAVESIIALALLGGIVLSARYVARLLRDYRWQEQTLARAKGAISEHIALRFQEWRLTPGEGEVALFALKGCDVAEIARLRGAAAGTIRSQLSQVYAKAGVTTQAMLVSLFIDDLIDTAPRS